MLRRNIHLTEAQIRFLDGLNGLTVAEHIRRAIDDYIIQEKIKAGHASFSSSRVVKGSEARG